jgi:hypothetical protein
MVLTEEEEDEMVGFEVRDLSARVIKQKGIE